MNLYVILQNSRQLHSETLRRGTFRFAWIQSGRGARVWYRETHPRGRCRPFDLHVELLPVGGVLGFDPRPNSEGILDVGCKQARASDCFFDVHDLILSYCQGTVHWFSGVM